MEVSDRILLGNGGYRLWGLAFLVACLPSTLAFDSAPIPPPPFPTGRGNQGYFMQGASPLASPGLGGMRHWGCLWKAGYGGGAYILCRLPTPPCRYSEGAFLLGCLPPLSLAYFAAPIPPTPFPTGRGRLRLSHARGFAPCIPGAGWDAALGLLVESGLRRGACFFGCLPPLPLAFDSAPIPPTPFPAGRGRFLVFLCKGLRPLHPRGWTGQGASYSCRSDTQGTLRQEDRAQTIGFSQYSIFGKSSGGSGGLFQESPSVLPSVLPVVSPVPSANAVRRERVRERPSRCMTV